MTRSAPPRRSCFCATKPRKLWCPRVDTAFRCLARFADVPCMHVNRSSWVLSLLACSAIAPAAHADVVTLGSDLQGPATIVQSNQADTAFWPTSIKGANPAAPADGQVLSIRVKGMAIQPDGAPAPLTEVHFQTLDPEAGDTYKAYLSSDAFNMPYAGDPNQVSEFKP